jgi:hypothetical protein
MLAAAAKLSPLIASSICLDAALANLLEEVKLAA